jgi:type II secretory pathway component HofQ
MAKYTRDNPNERGRMVRDIPFMVVIVLLFLAFGQASESYGTPSPAPLTQEASEQGQLVSLHFESANLLDLLYIFAEVSGLTVEAHPIVSSGIATLYVDNMPWDQALHMALEQNSLHGTIEGETIHIVPHPAASVEGRAIALDVIPQCNRSMCFS